MAVGRACQVRIGEKSPNRALTVNLGNSSFVAKRDFHRLYSNFFKLINQITYFSYKTVGFSQQSN